MTQGSVVVTSRKAELHMCVMPSSVLYSVADPVIWHAS
jgi:hypothetical protein